MAQTGFTPLSLYYSATTTNEPLAANLVAGELALNTADGKLFYKDSSGVVQIIGTKGGTGSSSTTQVLYNSSGLVVGSANMTFNGTILTSTGFAGPLNGTVGATTANTGNFTTLGATGNVTLGDATTDTVTVNGYMGVGGAGTTNVGVRIRGTALIGATQIGAFSTITAASDAAAAVWGFLATPATTAAAFTVSNLAGFSATDATKGAGSTITNQHGLYIADQTQGTNNYGITSLVSNGTNKWNIYANGTAPNYFAGRIGIEETTPAAQLVVSDQVTDARILIQHSGTGNTSSDGLLLAAIGSNFYVQGYDAYPLIFGTSGVERMRLDATGNLGIGTTSPTSTLSVTGTANVTGNVTLGDATTDSVTVNGYMGIGGAATASNGVWVRSNALTGTGQTGLRSVPTGSSAATSFISGVYAGTNTEAATFTTSAIYQVFVDNTTKGAGSTITNQYGVYVADQTQGTNNYGITAQVSSGTNKWNVYASGTANNYFAGNIGMGVTPSAWGGSSKGFDANTYGALAASTADVQVTGNAYFNGTNWIAKVTGAATRFVQTGGIYYFQNAPSVAAGASLTFSNAATLDASGNLGIGTTSPTSTLSVTGTANVTGNVTLGDATTDTVTVNGYIGVGGASNPSQALRIVNSGLTGVVQYGVYSAPVFTSTATTLAIGVAGRVDTADAAFTVADAQAFYAFNPVKGAASTITNVHGLRVVDQTSGTNNYGITTQVSSGTNKWNVYASGTAANYFAGDLRVGTLTAFASEKLSVFGSTFNDLASGGGIANTSFDWLVGVSGNTTYPVKIVVDQGDSSTKHGMSFYTSNAGTPSERMRIAADGNVGIGTSAPTARLELTTDSLNQGIRIYRPLATSGGGYEGILFALNNTSGTKIDYASISANSTIATTGGEAGSISFKTFGSGALTEKMRLDASGNLGIGTIAPAYKLDVNATVNGFIAAQVRNLSGDTSARSAFALGQDTNAVAAALSLNSSTNTSLGGVNSLNLANGLNAPITFATNNVERMRIDASGNLLVGTTVSPSGTGNIVPAAAKGVNFTGNTGAAGKTSQLLNWYEEGTWTPTATPQSGSLTAYTASGTYTRQGRTVFLTISFRITTAGTAAGYCSILGFPFAASNTDSVGMARENAISGIVYTFVPGGGTTAFIQSLTNGGIVWTNGYTYVGSLTYIV